MFINPNTEIPLCFTYIVDTTVTIAFVNHVGFVEVFVLQIEKGLSFPCQPNHLEDITVPVLLMNILTLTPFSSFLELGELISHCYEQQLAFIRPYLELLLSFLQTF